MLCSEWKWNRIKIWCPPLNWQQLYGSEGQRSQIPVVTLIHLTSTLIPYQKRKSQRRNMKERRVEFYINLHFNENTKMVLWVLVPKLLARFTCMYVLWRERVSLDSWPSLSLFLPQFLGPIHCQKGGGKFYQQTHYSNTLAYHKWLFR